jgi:hypothetical protein
MKNLLKNRTALSTVVTTLIILVVSVLLAGVVTYFAINVTSTRVQEESLNLQYQHVWFNSTDQLAEGAIMITNTGGRDVVLQKVAVRGQTVPVTDLFWFPVTTMGDLPYVSQKPNPIAGYAVIGFNATGHNETDITGTLIPDAVGTTTPLGNGYFNSTAGPIILTSGNTIAVYMAGSTTFAPGSVTVNDVGLTIGISIFTAQATYYKETNVNAAP